MIMATGLVIGLRQMGVFGRLTPGAGENASSSTDTAAPAASLEVTADIVAHEILAVQVDPDDPNQRTLRFCIRVTVNKDTQGIVATPFVCSRMNLALPPRKTSA